MRSVGNLPRLEQRPSESSSPPCRILGNFVRHTLTVFFGRCTVGPFYLVYVPGEAKYPTMRKTVMESLTLETGKCENKPLLC